MEMRMNPIARLSTMPGWEWVVPSENEAELIVALNRLGKNRPTEEAERVAARIQAINDRHSVPFEDMVKAFDHLHRAAVMAETIDLKLVVRHVNAFFILVSQAGLTKIEEVLQTILKESSARRGS